MEDYLVTILDADDRPDVLVVPVNTTTVVAEGSDILGGVANGVHLFRSSRNDFGSLEIGASIRTMPLHFLPQAVAISHKWAWQYTPEAAAVTRCTSLAVRVLLIPTSAIVDVQKVARSTSGIRSQFRSRLTLRSCVV